MNTKKLNRIMAIVMFLAFTGYSQSASGQQTAPPEKPKAEETKVEKSKQSVIKAEDLIEKETKFGQSETESGPTVEETAAWLKSKIDGKKVAYNYTWAKSASIGAIVKQESIYTNLRVENCTIQYKEDNQTQYSSQVSSEKNSYSLDRKINLVDIDPLSFSVSELEALMNKSLEEPASVSPTIFVIIVDIKGTENRLFLFSDRELAKRVVKAISHSTKQCGGKVEPF